MSNATEQLAIYSRTPEAAIHVDSSEVGGDVKARVILRPAPGVSLTDDAFSTIQHWFHNLRVVPLKEQGKLPSGTQTVLLPNAREIRIEIPGSTPEELKKILTQMMGCEPRSQGELDTFVGKLMGFEVIKNPPLLATATGVNAAQSL